MPAYIPSPRRAIDAHGVQVSLPRCLPRPSNTAIRCRGATAPVSYEHCMSEALGCSVSRSIHQLELRESDAARQPSHEADVTTVISAKYV